MKICLDLFAGLGGFSSAFADSARWDVTTVDRDERFNTDLTTDVWDLRPSDLPNADVILSSPPCRYFSFAGNHDAWENKEPVSQESQNAVGLVYHTLGLINSISPNYWFLENPRGRMRWVLGDPKGTVHYCQYGKEYKKPTDLWGNHPALMEYRQCSTPAGGGCHARNAADDGTGGTASMRRDPAERAKVPYELSESILTAVAGTGRQTSLTSMELHQ